MQSNTVVDTDKAMNPNLLGLMLSKKENDCRSMSLHLDNSDTRVCLRFKAALCSSMSAVFQCFSKAGFGKQPPEELTASQEFVLVTPLYSPSDQDDDSQWISGDGEQKQGESRAECYKRTTEKHRHSHSPQQTSTASHLALQRQLAGLFST